MIDHEEAERLLREAAYPRRVRCPHCGGEGDVVPEDPELLVHTRRGAFGADNRLDSVLDEIRASDDLRRGRHPVLGNDVLSVWKDGKMIVVVDL